jgi:hypothetical protein
MLDFHRHLLAELMLDDGQGNALVIGARGLGLAEIYAQVMRLFSEPTSLVLCINLADSDDADAWSARCEASAPIRVIKGDTDIQQRYVRKQVQVNCLRAAKSSTWKVVSLRPRRASWPSTYSLSDFRPIWSRESSSGGQRRLALRTTDGLTGAHRVTEFSNEAFVLRLYRDKNKVRHRLRLH